jgi:predicted nuclease of predicted toxin-antitoxin system
VRALVDEQLSPQLARLLRHRGHDVVSVRDLPALRGAGDRAVLDAAFEERRALITGNTRDFRHLAAERLARGQGHCGVIFVPAAGMRARVLVDRLAGAIEEVLTDHADGLDSSERWVGPLQPSAPRSAAPTVRPRRFHADALKARGAGPTLP